MTLRNIKDQAMVYLSNNSDDALRELVEYPALLEEEIREVLLDLCVNPTPELVKSVSAYVGDRIENRLP